ncbi:MAG: CRISPR-associated protein Cas4 [Elusimicrobia bacterium]|nr:CRISPR-associated protein Cas4 [Elusimicrobiota bacterium]
MYAEDDLLPISALQHLVFCERQCALIHLEGLWAENPLTVEGRHLHEKVDEQGPSESRGDIRIARSLPLRCLRLGLSGKADVVEFHKADADAPGIRLEGARGLWVAFPVEYKRGRPKRERCDEVQLCAQALCLEEMLKTTIPQGALFYGQTKRRLEVAFTPNLRNETEKTAARLHALIAGRITPKASRQPKCDNCSLIHACLPDNNAPEKSAASYLASVFAETHAGGPGPWPYLRPRSSLRATGASGSLGSAPRAAERDGQEGKSAA